MKKMIIGGIAAVAGCIGIVCGCLVFGNLNPKEPVDDTVVSQDVKKNSNKKDDKVDNSEDVDAAELDKVDDAGNTVTAGYVDNRGTQVVGTSSGSSFSIKMSDLCTFSDPSDISFDKRYVLYGGSDCIPAKRANVNGYSCKAAYVVLYASGGNAAGEYVCYVMSNEDEAKKYASAMAAGGYNEDSYRCGNWGDVTYVYSSGSYVQTSIDTYYQTGTIKSRTPEAYLAMGFYFGGMSEYHQSTSSGGTTPSVPDNPGTPNNPNNPGTPNNPNNPGTPDNPTTPDNPNIPDTPVPGETSTAVKAEQLTNSMEEAKTTKESSFPIKITDKYTFTDPEGLEYDARYVLYGGSDCGGVSAALQIGSNINSVYEIYYVKDGSVAGAYRCYDAKSEDDAKQIKTTYDGEVGEVTVAGRVACMKQLPGGVQDIMALLVNYGFIAQATPEAYMQQYLLPYENYKFFKNPTSAGEPDTPDNPSDTPDNPPDTPDDPSDTPDNPPVTELEGTAQNEAFQVILSDSYTYDESQVLPPDTRYDLRYVLYGGETCGYASQYQAKGFYEILYCANGTAMYELKGYVMGDNTAAGALAQELVSAGMYAVAMPGSNVVLVINADAQGTINGFAENNWIQENTPEAYLNGLFVAAGMREVENPADEDNPSVPPVTELEGTAQNEAFQVILSDSYTYDESQVLPPGTRYDLRYVLYGGETCGYASQYQAKGFYEILYCANGTAMYELKGYVMGDNTAAGALAQELVSAGMYAVAMPGSNVVLVINADAQGTINGFAENNWIQENTPEAYLNGLFVAAGMREVEKPAAESNSSNAGTAEEPVAVSEETAAETNHESENEPIEEPAVRLTEEAVAGPEEEPIEETAAESEEEPIEEAATESEEEPEETEEMQ